ncbi:hypothetical protein P167DRAFT_399887 [Morchella conica CCBAS932]|uniref:Uncharacterized protein n=1 Tax=Morchella conica CCBAS932 TaxID=1392247 RepID=A0A3N4KAL7_9PEZI|nr:hypothetical protein P167DRAFT_399887 [Morchella conica CCBAS932]
MGTRQDETTFRVVLSRLSRLREKRRNIGNITVFFLLIVILWKNYLPRKTIIPPKPAQRVQNLLKRV